jgi:small subunit ribosomal protein S16
LAVRIRLQRHGRKKRPFYRLVAADARAQRDGVFLERLGHYNPITDPADVVIDEEKAMKWLRRGAQPTDTAKRLLSQSGIWKKFTDEKLGKPLLDENAIETDAPAEESETATPEGEQEALLTEDTSEESESTEDTSEESESTEDTSEESESTEKASESSEEE